MDSITIALAVALLLALGGLVWTAYRWGGAAGNAKAERAEDEAQTARMEHQEVLKSVRKAQDIRREVDAMPPGAAGDELRDKWSRD